MPNENYIGGKWVPAKSGATDKVVNPATGEVLAEVPASDAADVEDAVAAAGAAFEEWSNTTPRQRYEALTKVADAAGIRLIDLAHAFVLAHRAVTSAIIGPRTMQQLRDVLAGADVRLDTDVLDEIDAIVPPGTNVNPADAGWAPPALSDPLLRRRSN